MHNNYVAWLSYENKSYGALLNIMNNDYPDELKLCTNIYIGGNIPF